MVYDFFMGNTGHAKQPPAGSKLYRLKLSTVTANIVYIYPARLWVIIQVFVFKEELQINQPLASFGAFINRVVIGNIMR